MDSLTMWDEGRARDFAGSHHGLIDRCTVLDFGANDHHIQARLDTGRWGEVHPGVYYLNVTPRTWLSEVSAAVMAAGPGALASHRTAAQMWKFDGVTTRMIELTVPITDNPEPADVTTHRTRRIFEGVEVDGVPVTTVERTLLDLAGLLPDRTMEMAMESAIRKRLTTLGDLTRALKLLGGRGVKGTRRFRRVLDRVDRDTTGSIAEVDALALISDAPIPFPVLQLRIPLPTGGNAYPDFAWPDRMRIVEVDGFDTHSSPERLDSDLRRQNLLMAAGWEIRRFSARDVRTNPDSVIGEITRFVLG